MRTAVAVLGTSREMTVCKRNTVSAAMTTGSTEFSGIDPWAPFPTSLTRSESDPAYEGPACPAIVPAGSGDTCWPRTMSGFGNRSNSPSSTMACAPAPSSSAGWKTRTRVPDQVVVSCERIRAAPSKQVVCRSWPHAWLTETVFPWSSVVVTVLA